MDFRIGSGLINSILVTSVSIFIMRVLDFLVVKDYSSMIYNNQVYQSSIWCWGGNVYDRRCRAINICYHSNYNQWIFINGPDSVQSGLPADLYRPALLSTSSLTGHNRFLFNYVTVESKYFKNLSSKSQTRVVNGETFIFSRFKPDNLMHLLHDDIIPLKWTLNGLGWTDYINLFMFDDWPDSDKVLGNRQFYSKIFRIKEIFTKIMDPDKLICFQEAYIGLDRETVWYQYGFNQPQGPLIKTDHQKANINLIANQLRSSFKPKSCSENNDYAVLLSRSFNRLILNEDELVMFLNKNFGPIIKIDVNGDLVNLIEKISCSNILIGMHGSNLILSLFLPHNSSIIEMFPFGINPDHYTPYKALAEIRGFNYIPWVNQNLTNSIQHPEYPISLGGINDLPVEIRSQIKDMTEDLEPHLCCHDPNWLYRIYQDTYVDIDHFYRNVVPMLSMSKKNGQKTRESLMYPGPVMNIECRFGESIGFKLTWNSPWNIELLDSKPISSLNYEVLIDKGDGKGYSIPTSSEYLIIPFDGKESFSLWIRSIFDGRKGPFTVSGCSIKGKY